MHDIRRHRLFYHESVLLSRKEDFIMLRFLGYFFGFLALLSRPEVYDDYND